MRNYLCLLILVVSGWSNAAENNAALNPFAKMVIGVDNIYQDIREAAAKGNLDGLVGREWLVTYEGEIPDDGSQIMVQITPTEAFMMNRIDKKTFNARLVNPHALVTAMGQLRTLDVKVSRITATKDPVWPRPGICTVFVSFRLTGTGKLIDLSSLKPDQYKLNYPADVATLVGISGVQANFSRITSASARVELQLFDPELNGWNSYYSDLPACKAAEAAPQN